ncbi:copper-binding protein [Roseateles sp. So40a]|uniref:copper-binding protein n=1 Tax=Roseateles sp. So40a TaxID=3400226 RepID=UPI003A8A9181
MSLRTLVVSIALAGAASVAPWVAVAANEVVSGTATKASSSSSFAQGEVKRIDAGQGKLTLKHGPIENLGMPGMTMVFRADASVLAQLQVGDQIRFKADKVDGTIQITELQK